MDSDTQKQLRFLEKQELTCADIEELMSDYLDISDEFIPTLRARISTHIAGCPCCNELESDFRDIIEIAGQLPTYELPEGAHKRLLDRLNAELGLSLRPL